MNVCEEAIISQTNNRTYGKSDHWQLIHLEEGDKLYQLDMGPVYDREGNRCINSGCFIDEDTYDLYWDPETNTFDIRQFCHDAQIAPYRDGTYKNNISEYVVGDGGLDVAYGTCENNTAFGEGGCSQIYVGEQSRAQLEKTKHQICPEISEHDRYIGEKNAHDMLEKSYNENWDLAEKEKSEGNDAKLNNQENKQGSMRGLADGEGLPPTDRTNNQDNEQAQKNGNEEKTEPQENKQGSMRGLVDGEGLPPTDRTNNQGNGQAQGKDNSKGVEQ